MIVINHANCDDATELAKVGRIHDAAKLFAADDPDADKYFQGYDSALSVFLNTGRVNRYTLNAIADLIEERIANGEC